MGVTAEEAVFIDDNPHNTESAEALGITSIVFTTVHKLRQDLLEIGVKP